MSKALEYVEPISKSFEEDDEAGTLYEAKDVLRKRLPADKNAALLLNPDEETVRPTSGLHIGEVDLHLTWRTCDDWIGVARPSRFRLCVTRHRVCHYHRRERMRGSGLTSM